MGMNKVHEYRGFKFNIKVELDHTVEKRYDGLRQHKITLNDMGPTNYYKTHLCETDDLLDHINGMINDAEVWVDNRIDESKSFEQRLLESMGFKK